QIRALCNHTVQPCTPREPAARDGERLRRGRQTHEIGCHSEIAIRECLQHRPSLFQCIVYQRIAALSNEQIEHDVHRRRLVRQFVDAACRWMYSLEQRIERQRLAVRYDELAVEHELLCSKSSQRCHDLREVARQRLARFRSQLHLCAIAKRDAAKAIPLGLVFPFRSRWKLGDGLRLHRRVAVLEWKRHRNFFSCTRPRAASNGAHKSPSSATRSGTVSIRNASRSTPCSTSSQLTGVDTVARGVGRTEYTEASVFPHAFWL